MTATDSLSGRAGPPHPQLLSMAVIPTLPHPRNGLARAERDNRMQGTCETAPTVARTSRRAPLATFFLSAVIAASTVFAVPSGLASANPETASGYLSWETPSPGPCPQNGWKALGDLSFEPSLHSQRIYAGTFKSENLETRKWLTTGFLAPESSTHAGTASMFSFTLHSNTGTGRISRNGPVRS